MGGVSDRPSRIPTNRDPRRNRTAVSASQLGRRDALLAFAASLAPHDILFLDRDITRPEQVDRWLEDVAAGDSIVIVALSSNEVVGYAALERSRLPWVYHVVELRLLVSPRLRRRGLGRALVREVFEIARELGVEKVLAQMTIDQDDAIAVFKAFGFRREAVLADQVRDRDGTKHDLVVMSLDVMAWEAALDDALSRPADSA